MLNMDKLVALQKAIRSHFPNGDWCRTNPNYWCEFEDHKNNLAHTCRCGGRIDIENKCLWFRGRSIPVNGISDNLKEIEKLAEQLVFKHKLLGETE